MERATSDVFLCKWFLGTCKNRIVVDVECWLYSKMMPLWMSLDAQQTNLAILATWQLGKQLE